MTEKPILSDNDRQILIEMFCCIIAADKKISGREVQIVAEIFASRGENVPDKEIIINCCKTIHKNGLEKSLAGIAERAKGLAGTTAAVIFADAQLELMSADGESTAEELRISQTLVTALELPCMEDPLPRACFANDSQTTLPEAASLFSAAKSAAACASAATERTKLLTVSLPAAYLALGQECASRSDLRPDFPELFAVLDRVRGEIENAAKALATGPKAISLAEKAKELAGKGVTLAASQAQKIRYKKALHDLGAAVYEANSTVDGQLELFERIGGIRKRITALDDKKHQKKPELSRVVHAAEKGSSAFNSVSTTGILGPIRGFLFSPLIVKASAILLAPIGLILIWLHPSWPRTTRVFWSGISVACFLGLAYIGKLQTEATRAMVAAADELWEQDKRPEAAKQYHSALATIGRLQEKEQAAVYGRLIDYESMRGQDAEAGLLVAEVVSAGLQIAPEFTRTCTLVDAHKRKLAAQAEARKREVKEEQERKKREALAKAEESESSDDTPPTRTAAQIRKEEKELEAWRRKNPDQAREADRKGRERAADDRRREKYMQELGKPSWDPTRDPSKFR